MLHFLTDVLEVATAVCVVTLILNTFFYMNEDEVYQIVQRKKTKRLNDMEPEERVLDTIRDMVKEKATDDENNYDTYSK